MKSFEASARLLAHGVILYLLTMSGSAVAQPNPGDPLPDINIVGPTRDPADIRDEGLKQQNEPACAMRPGDGDCIICFFNDYRTVDIFNHQDAWIGQAESCDAANTWTSRIVPGHPNHPAPIDALFAADPRVIALPGMAIHGFIGGFRDQDRGVIAIQHWLENNKDDFDYYEPGLNTIIVDEGTEGRFIDKPDFLAVLDESEPQGTVVLSTLMENPELGTIERTYPAGTLYAAYAVFTGSQSVKLLVKTSDDWGVTWRNKTTKLTESQNLVTGITLTSMNGIVIAMWRQVLDTNDVDAIYYATTANGGQNWSKPTLLTEICKFDQPSATFATQVTFRTNDFPWLANDGKNIFAFYTERVGGCATGVPKVVMQYSSDGQTWSDAQQVSLTPGGQFMPAAFGARGKVQVAWYDTRRDVPITDTQPFIADFIPETGVRVNRKIDVFTARITSGEGGNNVQVSDSVQVNRYRTATLDPNGPVYEIEASFANAMMYASGLLAFIGDYFAVTAPEFRLRESGGWEENQSALPAPASNLVDFFIAYADHRDVRGDVLFGDGGMTKPYTPPVNAPAGASTNSGNTTPNPTDDDERVLVAATEEKDDRQSAEGVEDAYTDPAINVCVPGDFSADRTRDANIYGSLIRDQLRLSSPVESRPLSGILRAIPFLVNNVADTETPYRLFIANQPGENPVFHRASFRQKPDRPPFPLSSPPVRIENVTVEPNSSVARTVFVVSSNLTATVDIQIFEGDCAAEADLASGDPLAFATECSVLGSITVGGLSTAGDIRQPDYLSEVCAGDPNPSCGDVLVTELHNPLIENPLIENPLIENPLIENPLIENPLIENPLIENPLIENYGFENPLIENPLIENPLIENPLIENPLIENPLIENPLIENPALPENVSVTDVTYTDITAVIRNDGNVTTAYNVDATVSGFTSTAGGETVSQLILWTQYVYGTARDCKYVPEARNQVLATINQPDNELSLASIEEPFEGEGSIILDPGQQGFITYRLWGTQEELENARINGFTASSQAANCSEFDDEFGPPPGFDPEQDDFYTCEDTIATGRERILIDIDSTGPEFNVADGTTIPVPAIEANAPGGACIQPVLGGLVSASDTESGIAEIICYNAEGDAICGSTFVDGVTVSIPVSNIENQPLQPAPMTCKATDTIGNETFVNLLVDVQDKSPPFFVPPFPDDPTNVDGNDIDGTADVILESGFTAQDFKGVDPDPDVACITDTGFTSDDPIPAGSHIVSCRAKDASGNPSAPSLYELKVNDVTPPSIVVPANFTLTASASGDVIVTYDVTTDDNVSTAPTINCDPPSGSALPIGETTVECTAVDGSGNTATASFLVTVVDNTAPTFTVVPGPIDAVAGPGGTAIVDYVVEAEDNSGFAPTIVCTPPSGSSFSLGVTTVSCEATDDAGNLAVTSFTVTVRDVTAPTITILEDPFVGSPDGVGGVPVDYSGNIEVTDNLDPSPTLACNPVAGSLFDLGITPVICVATDAGGNSSTAGFDVLVGYTGYGIIPTKIRVKSGSSNPLMWAWRDGSGNNLDSSADGQRLRIVNCDDPTDVVLDKAGDPGASGFRFKSDLSWEFNWQSDDNDGVPLLRGTYCAQVTNERTGQTLDSPDINVR